MSFTRSIVENIVNTKYETLPSEVVQRTKRHILDILAVMFPPSTLESGCQALEELAKDAGGNEESTLIGFGGKGQFLDATLLGLHSTGLFLSLAG